MTKIVRKVDRLGNPYAFWLNGDDELRGWCEGPDEVTADAVLEMGSDGWKVFAHTLDCFEVGTTLAALRDELTEEGKDGK